MAGVPSSRGASLRSVRLTPGTRVGPYEIVTPLGAGGMAEVYRARDARLDRDVALKVIAEALGSDPGLVARFEREARLAGSLQHPNVVAVHDVGQHEGAPYLVTELLQGETLRERLSRGPVPLATALDWTEQMAEGLAAAHARGIVHRDLKPENVFLTRDGRAKLLDFGIAKLVEALPGTAPHGLMEGTLSPSASATEAGRLFGSPGYMSPEQVRGEPVDARTDIFTLGAILLEMLSGKRAFPGASLAETLQVILRDEPAALPPEVPPPVARVVRRCLEKDPERRFQSAKDLAFHLQALRSGTGDLPARAGGSPSSSRRRWRLPLLAVLTLAAVALAARIGWLAHRDIQPSVQRLTFRRGLVSTARFAPDGRRLFFTASWSGEPKHIYSTTVDHPDFRPLEVEDAELLAVSSSGELAITLHPTGGFFTDGDRGLLARVPAVGGAPREVLDGVSYADWAPDAANLAVVHQVGSRSRLEFPIGHVLYESSGWLSHPRVSPKGDRVAFIEHPSLYDYPGSLLVVDASGRSQLLAENSARIGGVAWSPAREEVLFTQDEGTGRLFSVWASDLKGRQRLVYRGTTDLILEDLSRDGRALALAVEQRLETGVTKVGDPSVKTLSWLSISALDDISSDGSTVLFTENDRTANLGKTDGAPPVHLFEAKALALSLDGKWALAVRAHEVPESRALLLLPTGAGLGRSIDVTPLEIIRRGRFLPDGRRVAVIARDPDSREFAVHLVDTETGKAKAISPPGLSGYFLEVSPDGKRVATVGAGGVLTVYPVEGGPAISLSELGPLWVPAGWAEDGGLFVRQLYDIPARVYRLDLGTRRREPLVTIAPPESSGVHWMSRLKVTPDKRMVGFTYSVESNTVLALDWHERN
jgi:serine/threonine protein kinase/dipeptidyl aminopeptidase/acylaminoacyl peptidase